MQDYASGGSKWVLDSGCTSHMTGSKNIITEMKPNVDQITVSYGDKSKSQVLGLGKVVVVETLMNVMLVETLGYNLMSVHALAEMGFGTYFDIGIVVLMWSRSLKVAFVGYVEHGLYVVDFSGESTASTMCLIAKGDVGWLWHRRLAHVNMRTLQSLCKGGHIVGINDACFARDCV